MTADYHTPEYVLEYVAERLGCEPEVLRADG